MKKLTEGRGFWLAMVVVFALGSLGIGRMLLNEPRRTFAATYMTMNNPFYQVINGQLQKGAATHGDRLVVRDPLLDPAKQVEQIEGFIEQGVDGIFVNPVDPEALVPVLEKASQAGIPVIALDTNMTDESLVTSTVVSDNYEAGRQCGLHLLEKTESARIWLLRHSLAQSADERIRGFLSVIEGRPGYTVIGEAECEGQLEKAMPAMEQLLEKDDSGMVVMALNDPSALGAIAALQRHGLENVRVYGVDGTPDMKARIASCPELYATVAQSPLNIGSIASETMYRVLEKEPVDPLILVPVSMINEKTRERFALAGWQ